MLGAVMFRLDITLRVAVRPDVPTSKIDMQILEAVEKHVKFKPLSHVEKTELAAPRGFKRFRVTKAFGMRDK
jgi:hypothetical protein